MNETAPEPALARDGFVVMRLAIPTPMLSALRAAFDAGVLASDEWPVPRGPGWRHAQVDLDPAVQAACRLPPLLEAVGSILRQPFFLSQVEGREPLSGGGAQSLHRDGDGDSTYAAAMFFLDDYGAYNGATQVVPGSHRDRGLNAESAHILEGYAGDIVVFDPDLLHGATCNVSGQRRRSLLLSYALAAEYDALRASEALRGVRMDTSEVFAIREQA